MEQVCNIPELVNLILTSGDTAAHASVIAKLRMVCQWARAKFATVVGTQEKVRLGAKYAAITYSAPGIFARGWYGGDRAGPLRRIAVGGDDCRSEAEYSTVHYINEHVGGGFELEAAEFVAINRLFGIPAAAYGIVLVQDWNVWSLEYVTIKTTTDFIAHVKVGGLIHTMFRVSTVNAAACGTMYYRTNGVIYECNDDIPEYENLRKLTRLTW